MSPGNPAFPSPAPDTSAQIARTAVARAEYLLAAQAKLFGSACKFSCTHCATSRALALTPPASSISMPPPIRLGFPFVITPGIMRFGSFWHLQISLCQFKRLVVSWEKCHSIEVYCRQRRAKWANKLILLLA